MAKHKYIETPEKMWEHFEAYAKEVKSKPFVKNGFAGKDAEEVMFKMERPLTLDGFEMYMFRKKIINDLGDYFSNKDNKYADFSTICARIRQAIRQDQIEGGMAGIYNPSITQRLNGLTEKIQEDGTKEVNIKVKYERKGTDSNPE